MSEPMTHRDALRTYGLEIELPPLVDGMVLVLYTDKGPSGPCGQSMNVTCPHASISIFPDIATMKRCLEDRPFRRGQRADIRYFIIGESGDGQLSFNVHERCE